MLRDTLHVRTSPLILPAYLLFFSLLDSAVFLFHEGSYAKSIFNFQDVPPYSFYSCLNRVIPCFTFPACPEILACLLRYLFFLLILVPARLIKPVPRRSTVDGSGTGAGPLCPLVRTISLVMSKSRERALVEP